MKTFVYEQSPNGHQQNVEYRVVDLEDNEIMSSTTAVTNKQSQIINEDDDDDDDDGYYRFKCSRRRMTVRNEQPSDEDQESRADSSVDTNANQMIDDDVSIYSYGNADDDQYEMISENRTTTPHPNEIIDENNPSSNENDQIMNDSATTMDTRWHERTGDGEHGFMSKNQSISARPNEVLDEDNEFTDRNDSVDTDRGAANSKQRKLDMIEDRGPDDNELRRLIAEKERLTSKLNDLEVKLVEYEKKRRKELRTLHRLKENIKYGYVPHNE